MVRPGGSAQDLSTLLSPRSVAVVGASGNLESISGRPIKLLKRFGFKGHIFPVNPNHDSLAGLKCYPDIRSLPLSPDVVLVGVRAQLVPGVVEQLSLIHISLLVGHQDHRGLYKVGQQGPAGDSG